MIIKILENKTFLTAMSVFRSNTSILAQKKKNQKKKANRKRAFDRRHSEGSESEKHEDFDDKVSVGVQFKSFKSENSSSGPFVYIKLFYFRLCQIG